MPFRKRDPEGEDVSGGPVCSQCRGGALVRFLVGELGQCRQGGQKKERNLSGGLWTLSPLVLAPHPLPWPRSPGVSSGMGSGVPSSAVLAAHTSR